MKKFITLTLLFLGFQIANAQNGVHLYPNFPTFSIVSLRGQSGIAVDDTGRVWLSYSGFHTWKFTPSDMGLLTVGSDSIWKKITLDSLGGPNTKYLSSIQYTQGALWMGSDKGLIRKQGKYWNVFAYPGENPERDTVNNFIVQGNTYYMATQTGVHVCYKSLSSNIWTIYNSSNSSLPTNKIYAIDIDQNGKYWLGTNLGVIHFDPKKNESIIYNKLNSGFWTDTIYSIKVLSNGEVWAGTFAGSVYQDPYGTFQQNCQPGLFKLQGNQFKNIVEILGTCQFYSIPKCDFYSLKSEDNQIIFAGFNALGFPTLCKTNGTHIELTPLPALIPRTNTVNGFHLTTYQDKLYFNQFSFNTPLRSIFQLKRSIYIPDSTQYYFLHQSDTTEQADWKETRNNLHINNLQVPISLKGDIFNNGFQTNHYLSGNKNDCKQIAVAGSLWMGGIADGELHLAAATYRQNGVDFANGPLKIGLASTTDESKLKYARSWKIEERTIENFKQNYNQPNYKIPEEIFTWPAHGDSSNGFASNLAPFIDKNGNGKYEPTLGDYPKINGQQEVYWIFNDKTNFHGESEGLPLGIEIHGSVYAYVCNKILDSDSNKALNNTFFLKYRLINRSTRTYTNFKIGFWIDHESGNYMDDEFGSNPKENYAYWFNADTLDEGIYGFGKEQPGSAIILLKSVNDSLYPFQKLGGVMGYRNDFSVAGNPTRAEHYYNYLNNHWKDGMPLTFGADGRTGMDSDEVYMFSGNNDLKNRNNWVQPENTNPGTILEYRLMLNSKSITLHPNEEQEIEYAIVNTPTQSNQKETILNALHKDVMKIKNWYAMQNFPACSTLPLGIENSEGSRSKNKLLVFPNPGSGKLNYELENGEKITQVSVYDISGKLCAKEMGTDLKNSNFSHLPAGLYFLQIQAETGVYQKKIILH